MTYTYTRTNHLMRAQVNIAITNAPDWGTRAAAEYLMRREVPLHIALRVLAGRITQCN